MQALRYNAKVDANGRFALPQLDLRAGTSVEIIVLVPDTDEDTEPLVAASLTSLDFWDNSVDDEVWNNA